MYCSRAIVILKTIPDSSAYAFDSSVEELCGPDWLKTMFFCLFVFVFVFFVFLSELSLLFLVDMIAETFPIVTQSFDKNAAQLMIYRTTNRQKSTMAN